VSEADGSQDRPGFSRRHPRWSAVFRLFVTWMISADDVDVAFGGGAHLTPAA
jgi:hypothetical protein